MVAKLIFLFLIVACSNSTEKSSYKKILSPTLPVPIVHTEEINFINVCLNSHKYSADTIETMNYLKKRSGLTTCKTAWAKLKEYTHFTISSSKFKNFLLLNGLNKLKKLEIKEITTTRIHMPVLTGIESLNFGFLKSKEINYFGLNNLKSLKTLRVENCNNHLDLTKLEKLKVLGLRGCQASFENLRGLKELSIQNTNLENLDFVKNMPMLQTLWANSNQLNNIEGLIGHTQLESVYLQNNLIVDHSVLFSLENLQEVFISTKSKTFLDSLKKRVKKVVNY